MTPETEDREFREAITERPLGIVAASYARGSDWYQRAMDAARLDFAPLTAALSNVLRLDVEPVVDQTGGMVMCLAIHWPDDSGWTWISADWDDPDGDGPLLGLYDHDEDQGTYPDTIAPRTLGESREAYAYRVADHFAPAIRAHGARHGWEAR